MKRRVLVLSPNTWDLDELTRDRYRSEYEFVFVDAGFYNRHVLVGGVTFDVLASIAHAIDVGRAARVEGVIGTHDYPASLQAAAVAAGLGLPGPSVASALLCHHKYLCREAQRRAVPEAVPAFGLIDPFRLSPDALPLPFPFFVKPVKGTLSLRAAVASDYASLTSILRCSPIEKLAARAVIRPFNRMLEAYTSFNTHANWFIAEEVLHGDAQVTVDAFADRGRVEVMGIVDSVMYPGTRSFQRFVYPSRLPEPVQARMRTITARIAEATEFTHGCFNVELIYDAARDHVSVIEMNPRMCTQFADLYEKVDGTSGYDVQLALATGQRPEFRRGQGRHAAAASFVLRTFDDQKVAGVPSPEHIADIRQRFPDTIVKVLCEEGQWLSDQPQDMDSYRYGIVNMGAESREALEAAFEDVRRLLDFRFAAAASRREFVPRFHGSPRQRPLAT